jgi:hypothetical protein
MWSGSHEQEATTYGRPADFCRHQSRVQAGIAAGVAVVAIGLAAFAWFVVRDPRDDDTAEVSTGGEDSSP